MTDYSKEANRAAKEIQRLLLQNRAHTYLHKQTKGKLLDMKNVGGIMTYGTNIYKRQLINDEAEYELCLVLDLSGSIYCSMGGENPFKKDEFIDGLHNSIYYAYLLAKIFIPVLGKKSVSVYGFNRDHLRLTELLLQHRYNKDNTYPILKEMAEVVSQWTSSSPTRISEKGTTEAVGGSRAGGNHDGYALMKSVQDTAWTVEDTKHRIVIHFSDGQPLCHGSCGLPGCGRDGALRRDLHNSVRKLRESGYVCIGVGLGHDGVEEYYGDLSIVANNPQEMYTKTIDIIRKQMKRGNFK